VNVLIVERRYNVFTTSTSFHRLAYGRSSKPPVACSSIANILSYV